MGPDRWVVCLFQDVMNHRSPPVQVYDWEHVLGVARGYGGMVSVLGGLVRRAGRALTLPDDR